MYVEIKHLLTLGDIMTFNFIEVKSTYSRLGIGNKYSMVIR